MNLNLPQFPAYCDNQTANFIHDQLTSVIVGHANATSTFSFYEEIDNWLGPWGEKGYPIGYGKFYNKAFSSNQKLMADPTAKQWVCHTAILLQEAVRDYIVKTMRNNSSFRLTEPNLRKAAFDSHPRAYDRGGLASLVMLAPELIPVIATIPNAEFFPTSSNFSATITQVFKTAGLIVPKMTMTVLTSPVGKSTNVGGISRGARQDQRFILNLVGVSQQLGRLKYLIIQGKLDYIPWLNQTIAQLNSSQFLDTDLTDLTREVIQTAQTRKRRLQHFYRVLFNQSPEFKMRYNRIFSVAF